MNIRTWKARYYIEMRLLYNWLMDPDTSFEMLTDERPIIVQAMFTRDHIQFFDYLTHTVYRNQYLDKDEKKLFVINRSQYVEKFVSTIIELRYRRGAELDFNTAVKDKDFSVRINKAFECIGGAAEFEDDYLSFFKTNLSEKSKLFFN